MATNGVETPKGYVIFGHWAPRPDTVDELLNAFKPVLQYSKENTEILCYYLLREQKEDGAGAIVTAACFSSQDAYTQYLQHPSKCALDATCLHRSLLTDKHYDQLLDNAAGFPLRSPHPSKSQEPNLHTMMAKITYSPGTRPEGINQWQRVATSVKETEEEGTYAYWFLADPESEDVLYSLELYKNKEYLWDVHVPSDAIQGNMKAQKDIRIGLELRVFKTVI